MGTIKWNHSTNTPTYNSWKSMRNRCSPERNPKHYYLRGIKVCDRWKNFDYFYEDMGERPEGTTLDRLNNSIGYFKENCRWASHRVQQNNKESLTRIKHEGLTLTIGEWCHRLGYTRHTKARIYKRHQKYGAKTYAELFSTERLSVKRYKERVNKCLECDTEKTCKWRKNGTQCNTCWHKEYRKLPKKFDHGRT